MIFSIIPVIIKIVFIDFIFLILYLWAIWCVDIYIAVIIHSKWRNIRTASQLHGVWWQSCHTFLVQISTWLKEALKVDYLLGFPLLPPEPLSPAPRSGSRTWSRSRSRAPSNYGSCEIRPDKLIIRHHSLQPVITKSLFGKTKEILFIWRATIRISTKT